MDFKSTHNLQFKNASWIFPEYLLFRIGTVGGLWNSNIELKRYNILAVDNSEPGNGHLEDVFDWFEMSCKRDKYDLVILEIFNDKFYNHLVDKRGFKDIQINGVGQSVIKFYKTMK